MDEESDGRMDAAVFLPEERRIGFLRKSQDRNAKNANADWHQRIGGALVVKLTEIYDSVVAEGSNAFAEVIAVLEQAGMRYAVIGGLAVNAYVEPVFTADANIVIALNDVDRFTEALLGLGYTAERYPFLLNFRKAGSDLSLQVSTDPVYQGFLDRSDLVEGKIRAWSDPERRLSKRAKDQTDLFRIAERYPEMIGLLPGRLKAEIAEHQAGRAERASQNSSPAQRPSAESESPGIDR